MSGTSAAVAAEIGSAAIGAGASVGSGIGSRRTSYEVQRRQNAHNLEMWNKNNAYNSPVEQMKRQLQAGLNPVADEGIDNGNSSQPAQGADYNEVRPLYGGAEFISALQGVANILKTQEETKTIEAQRNPQLALLRSQAEQIQEGIKNMQNTFELNKFTSEWQKKIAEGNLEVADKQMLVNYYNAYIADKVANNNKLKIDADIKLLKLQGEKVIEETKSVKQLRELDKERFVFEKGRFKMDKQRFHMDKQEFRAKYPYLRQSAKRNAFGDGLFGLYNLPDWLTNSLPILGKKVDMPFYQDHSFYDF